MQQKIFKNQDTNRKIQLFPPPKKKRETEDNVVQEFKNKLSAGKRERAKVLAKIHNFVKRLQHLLKQAPLRLDFVESSEK